MSQILRVRNRYGSVDGLRLRLLAALGGVTVSLAACSGRSQRETGGSGSGATGGDEVTGGTGATGGKGGSGGTGATGGKGGSGGTGATGGKGGSGGTGAAGTGAVGGTGADGGGGNRGGSGGASGAGGSAGQGASGAGGSLGGMGGSAGKGHTLGCRPTGDYGPGLESCDGTFVHRTSAEACTLPPHVSANGGQGGATDPGGTAPQCLTDDECQEAPNGYCAFQPSSPFGSFQMCLYGCATDADCADNQLCSCFNDIYVSAVDHSPLNLGLCTGAECRTDADCNAPSLCVGQVQTVCGDQAPVGFRCQKPDDQCSGPGDCPNPTYQCEVGQCVSLMCGRPFLVEGELRVAGLTGTPEWLAGPLSAPVGELGDEERRAVADHFARAGLLEHASVAAFARFTLQLLALGAPPELIEASTRAQSDETRHARLCFELASRYAGRALGPGPLAVDGALLALDLPDVVELVFAEGCIGETAAALEASWAAEAATEPEVRDVLREIAADEERHAALAWRFVAWAVTRDARVGERVARALARALDDDARLASACTPDENGHLAEHGVLSAAARRAARSLTLREVLPALVARLSRAPSVATLSGASSTAPSAT